MAHKQYWLKKGKYGELRPEIEVEFRGGFAMDLVRSYGAVAGKPGEEDRSGRARLDLQTPEELVERCFKIADLVVEKLEERGEIKFIKDEDVEVRS